jgi:predicted transcriptional regulator YdeE
MKSESTKLGEIKLVGISVRTKTQDEFNPETAKIGQTFGRFLSQNIGEKIKNRKNPGVLFSVYTNYESNEHGEYTYFIGEEVTHFDDLSMINEGLKSLSISAAKYQKFTTESGKLPDVVIQAWMEIWKMSPQDLGGERAYLADFEIYDHRAMNPLGAVVDVYIGVKAPWRSGD